MSVREYIGARYVPIFADPIEWDGATAYEPLTIVTYNGSSYTSRQYVPASLSGTPDTLIEYWALTGNYNAQVEGYRQEVLAFDGRITENAEGVAANTEAIAAEIEAREEAIAAEIEAREEADTHLQEKIDALARIEENNAGYLAQWGILRVDINNYNAAKPTDNTRQAQGMCISPTTLTMLYAGDNGPDSIYNRHLNSTTFEYIKDVELDHGGDIIFVEETNEYWVTGDNGLVRIFNESFNQTRSFNIGQSVPLLAYDKVTRKVYANPYWGSLYEINPDTLEETLIDENFPANSYKQAFTAYNNVLYVLFSFANEILCYDIPTKEITSKITLIENDVFKTGETEGIDFDAEGNLYISTALTWAQGTVKLAPIYKVMLDKHEVSQINAPYRNNCFVDPHTEANMLSHQTPNGSSTNAFVTLDEAMLYVSANPQINQIVVKGDHSTEHVFTTQALIINGQTENGAKPKLGSIYNTSPFLFVNNITFNPRDSIDYIIKSFRKGPLSIAALDKTGEYSTTTSGVDINSQYPINKSFNYTENI